MPKKEDDIILAIVNSGDPSLIGQMVDSQGIKPILRRLAAQGRVNLLIAPDGRMHFWPIGEGKEYLSRKGLI